MQSCRMDGSLSRSKIVELFSLASIQEEEKKKHHVQQ